MSAAAYSKPCLTESSVDLFAFNLIFKRSYDVERHRLLKRDYRDMGLKNSEEGVGGIVLGAVLNLAEARPLAQRFIDGRGKDIVVDASAVDLLGAPCAQVLLSAIKTWQADGHTIDLRTPSEGFCESARLLGLTQLIAREA